MRLEVFMPLFMKFMNLNQDTVFIQVHAVYLTLADLKTGLNIAPNSRNFHFGFLYIWVLEDLIHFVSCY